MHKSFALPTRALRARERQAIRRQVREVARRLAARFHPRRIVLFGSHAYGRPTTHSDVDLLVVVDGKGRSLPAAAAMATSAERSFPMDLLVMQTAALRKRVREGDVVMRDILARGKVLHEAIHARVA